MLKEAKRARKRMREKERERIRKDRDRLLFHFLGLLCFQVVLFFVSVCLFVCSFVCRLIFVLFWHLLVSYRFIRLGAALHRVPSGLGTGHDAFHERGSKKNKRSRKSLAPTLGWQHVNSKRADKNSVSRFFFKVALARRSDEKLGKTR